MICDCDYSPYLIRYILYIYYTYVLWMYISVYIYMS